MSRGHSHVSREGYLGACAVAEALGVSRRTVLRWCVSGELPHERTPGGQVRVPAEHVERLLGAPLHEAS